MSLTRIISLMSSRFKNTQSLYVFILGLALIVQWVFFGFVWHFRMSSSYATIQLIAGFALLVIPPFFWDTYLPSRTLYKNALFVITISVIYWALNPSWWLLSQDWVNITPRGFWTYLGTSLFFYVGSCIWIVYVCSTHSTQTAVVTPPVLTHGEVLQNLQDEQLQALFDVARKDGTLLSQELTQEMFRRGKITYHELISSHLGPNPV